MRAAGPLGNSNGRHIGGGKVNVVGQDEGGRGGGGGNEDFWRWWFRLYNKIKSLKSRERGELKLKR